MSDLGFTVSGRLNTDSSAAKGVGCGKIHGDSYPVATISSSTEVVRHGEGTWSGEPCGSDDQIPGC
eukprot:2549259-Amphidinium_carterae.1